MRRHFPLTAAMVIVGLTTVAEAQTRVRSPMLGPRVQAGVPLPRIDLPLGPIGLPPAIQRPVPRIARPFRPDIPQRRFDRRDRFFDHGRSPFFFGPAYGWGYPYPYPYDPYPYPYEYPFVTGYDDGSSGASTEYPEPAPVTGRLDLEIQPDRNLQFSVDGYYVGTSDDFGDELELPAGPHTVEISSPGYETLSVDVRISAGRSITYRAALKPLDTKPGPDRSAPAPAAPSTIYMIPGCYLGNVPPKDVALPATCDLSRVTTLDK